LSYAEGGGTTTYLERHPRLIVHELGHVLRNTVGENTGFSSDLARTDCGDEKNFFHGYAGDFESWQFAVNDLNTTSEQFADSFLGWVYGRFYDSPLGDQRRDFMNGVMSELFTKLIP